MRRLLILLGLAFTLQSGAFADTLKLLDGKVITGTFLGGDARTIRMEVGNKIEMFPISEVDSLSFGGGVAGDRFKGRVDVDDGELRVARVDEHHAERRMLNDLLVRPKILGEFGVGHHGLFRLTDGWAQTASSNGINFIIARVTGCNN